MAVEEPDCNANGVPDALDLTPSEHARLTDSDAAAGDFFGCSVSVSGDVVVIGAAGDYEGGSDSGSAYVFRWDGSSWVEEAKLTGSDAAGGDYFGFSVSVSGDVAVIGAPKDDDDGDYSGSAYVFRWDGSAWFEQAKLTASDAATGPHLLGRSVRPEKRDRLHELYMQRLLAAPIAKKEKPI